MGECLRSDGSANLPGSRSAEGCWGAGTCESRRRRRLFRRMSLSLHLSSCADHIQFRFQTTQPLRRGPLERRRHHARLSHRTTECKLVFVENKMRKKQIRKDDIWKKVTVSCGFIGNQRANRCIGNHNEQHDRQMNGPRGTEASAVSRETYREPSMFSCTVPRA